MRPTGCSSDRIALRGFIRRPKVRGARDEGKMKRLISTSSLAPRPSPLSYEALPSVWAGTDAQLLDRMLRFYPRKPPERILDATANRRRFWKGLSWRIVGMDINACCRPDVVGDNRSMPFADRCFDVVVYDPPHVPNQGRDRTKDFNDRFGLVLKAPAAEGYNFTHLYP